ncbi:MAG TPA: AIR synthase-related protein, partial [Spongiibacteraceae bacterium]|nr:AIR synthase-related protein [Spongiibacteraceae bacterium]
RKIIDVSKADLNQAFGDSTLGQALMAPTRIYVKALLALIKTVSVNSLCHITGGGLLENLPRVLPDNCKAVLDLNSYQRPAVFDWLQKAGGVDAKEMYRVFNCGVGMVVCVQAADQEAALQTLRAQGEMPFVIGRIEARRLNQEQGNEEQVQLQGLRG